jgi:hypothetical protein
MSGNQDTQKLDNPEISETGSDAGEPSNESQHTDSTGAEGTKSDKQKSKMLTYMFILHSVSTCVPLYNLKNFKLGGIVNSRNLTLFSDISV